MHRSLAATTIILLAFQDVAYGGLMRRIEEAEVWSARLAAQDRKLAARSSQLAATYYTSEASSLTRHWEVRSNHDARRKPQHDKTGWRPQEILLPYRGRICSDRKLIINSHVEYHVPFVHLVASLKRHNFTRFQDIVVFRGGAKEDSGPYLSQDRMIFVNVSVNSYDLNAMYGLAKYKDDPAVCARMYFYIHDSTTVGPCFPQVFDDFDVASTEVITPGMMWNSNQCMFGGSVVDKFGRSFDKNFSKGQGFQIEAAGGPVQNYAKKHTVIRERVLLGDVDIYSTGMKRTCQWYQDFDLYKYILWQPNHDRIRHDIGHHTNGQAMTKQQGRRIMHPKWAPTCKRQHFRLTELSAGRNIRQVEQEAAAPVAAYAIA